MQVFKKLSLLVAGLSLVSTSMVKRQEVPSTLHLLAKGDISDMQYLGYLVLIKGSTSTECEVAILSETTGIVAANCIDWDANGQPARSDYRVGSFGSAAGATGVQEVSKVVRHPAYNPSNFANNVAVIWFGSLVVSPSRLQGNIADDPSTLLNSYNVYRSLASISPLKANELNTWAYLATETKDCKDYSPLFAASPNDYVCNHPTVDSVNSPGCVTGYSSIYGALDNNVAIHALYSFSVSSESTGLCGTTGMVMNYYTILRNYLAWALSLTNTEFNSIHGVTRQYTPATPDVGYAAINKDSNGNNINAASGGYVARNGLDVQAPMVAPIARIDPVVVDDSESTAIQVMSTVLTIQTATSTILVTESVTSSSTVVVSSTTTETVSTTATTTATTTDTATTTQTTMVTSVIGATSTDVATSTISTTTTFTDTVTATVTATVDAAINNNAGIPQGNNINISLNAGQANAATITVTSTETVSSVSTATDTSVLTVTATVYLSASIVPGQTSIIGIPATTVAAADINTVTVTSVSTSLVRSIYTVTAVPPASGNNQAQETVSGVITVTETVPSMYLVTVTQTVTDTHELGPLVASSEPSSASTTAISNSTDEVVVVEKEKKKLSAGLIVGLAILVLVLLAVLWYFFCYKGKRDSQTDGYTNQQPGGLSRVRNWMFNQNNDRFNHDSPPDYMTQIR